ncbi:High-affinity glucose transporter [Neolecta irregularis DAH-3]|uniref:High-affinity glucose transporter n=1 Tax=Neolecta irregularis (strain DAH-3) TaxID=1198029 RepID=A0A1U7LU45_NEOID|nr:High-affinity glucose transporter [Neolecta irregularis DAH-3]|eukprot:OLL26196.1 High-affinity glucose transporter [Neolecta irregularis DAH-3]
MLCFTSDSPWTTSLVATIGGGLFGFDISSVSAFIGTQQYKDYFHNPNSNLQGGITASMSAGSFAGSLVAGYLSDRLGRRKAIQIGAVIWMFGSIVQATTTSVVQLVIGRVINGICVGITSSQVPVYLAEVSPKHIRGRIVGLQQWAITWGIMIMFYVSYACSKLDGPKSFRLAWALQMIPAILLFFGLSICPESPRWLYCHGEIEQARIVLANVHAGGDMDSRIVRDELSEMREAAQIRVRSASVSLFDLFRPAILRTTFTGVFAQIWQQLTGMNVMMYYIVYVFDMAGKTGNNNLIASSIQYVINVVMTVPGLFLIDHVGRRPMFLVGSTVMMILLFTVAGLLSSHGHFVPSGLAENTNVRWVVSGSASTGVIVCTYLFVATFASTWGPAGWIYISEIFPLEYRARGNGICGSANWIFNFALAYFVPPAFHNILWKTYLLFGVFCFAMTVHVFFFFPETRNKSLEAISVLFSGKISAWKSKNYGNTFDQTIKQDNTETWQYAARTERVSAEKPDIQVGTKDVP